MDSIVNIIGILYGLVLILVYFVRIRVLESMRVDALFMPQATENSRPVNLVVGIARWAAGLVKDGDTILLDASTTVFCMVPFLAERRNLVVLTNGMETGRQLAGTLTNSVILMAGILSPDGASVIGPLYEPALRRHPIKTAFVSCQGFSMAAGLTETDTHEAAMKNRMVSLADSTVALIDSSKFGQVLPAPFARANQVAHIFSDSGLAPDWAAQVQEASIVLTLCQSSN